ncbi:hypothetical protein HPB52_021318 [Rhipicephalus sanguineus]|uniref:Uncharacterized protein n=1 Tax=Rhipicephalus sanguineus TaxID=34632 RepID=A0A9D4PE00_RHISA|nr:hypothetical protein HPB52_021318 [Rhipicephalus sanguineus]
MEKKKPTSAGVEPSASAISNDLPTTTQPRWVGLGLTCKLPPFTMEIVHGEAISPEEANGPDWIMACNRKSSKSKAKQPYDARPTSTLGRRRDGGCTTGPRSAYQRLVATSRFPQLPRDTCRVILRPRDGINVAKITTVQFEQFLAMAAALAPQYITEYYIFPNVTQNELRLRDTLYRVAISRLHPTTPSKASSEASTSTSRITSSEN